MITITGKQLNMAKENKLVFYQHDQPNARNYLSPAELPCIKSVLYTKLLGELFVFMLQDDLDVRKHNDYDCIAQTQSICLPSYFNRRDRVCHRHKNRKVFNIIILVRVLYAVTARRGYLSTAESDCLQQLLDRAKHWKITSDNNNNEKMFDDCDITLLKSS